MSKADDNEARQVREREMRHMRDTREMRLVEENKTWQYFE